MSPAKTSFVVAPLKSGILLLICSFGLMELILHVLSWSIPEVSRVLARPSDREPEVVSDVRLGLRGNPLHPGHDEAGYRNRERLTRADIVTLGDSLTYGLFVAREASWPQVLAVETHHTVYNMGVDGAGPGEYYLQLEEALSLKPRRLVLGLYFGNDFFDAFAFSSRHPQVAGAVDSDLKKMAERLEKERPIQLEFNRAFGIERKETQPETTRTSFVPLWVSKNVKLYGLVRAFKNGFIQTEQVPILSKKFEEAADSLSPIQRQYFSVFAGATWRTILGGGYRSLLVDNRDPRFQVGFEVTQRLLDLMAVRCRTAGVNFLVVLLPTKDSVFWPRVPDPENHRGLRQLVMDEERLKNTLVSYLREHAIDFVDLLEPLRKAPTQPYFENADGHPNAAGHQVIGREIAAYLSKRE